MSNVLLFINNVDRTEYFRPPLRVSPGGDGVIGTASINLSQQAGGLDIRPMDDVKILIPFNTTTNAGVASKGRLYGGIVSKRATGNVGTTKTWSLPTWDYNIILKKHRRRAAAVYAVTLTPAALNTQIIQLFAILQGSTPDVQLDVVSGVALTTAMPAVTYPGGHTWEWYLQQLLATAHSVDPAVFPAYYMGVGTTFGGSDTFGPPVLWVYDAASPPASVVTFSDTPTGSEKSVFATFTRDTDATALNQVVQSWWNGQVRTATDTASQSNYPSPYEDFSGGTGFWTDGEVINDTSSANATEAQALVDNIVRAKGAPRDSFKWGTYERVMPGEYVDLEWTLEGIPPATQIRIASATFEWEEPNVIYTTLTANTRRLGLFDNGMQGFFASPIEGDDVPPLPAADFTVASNVYNLTTRDTDVTFDIDNTGGSPDTVGYKIVGGPSGAEIQTYDVGLDLSPTLALRPGQGYSFRVYAYDNSGNLSESFPEPTDPALTFTTATPSVTAPTGFQIDTGLYVSGFLHISDFQAIAALEWTPTYSLPSYGWYDLRYWRTADPTQITTVRVGYNLTGINIGPLIVGQQYDAEIQPMLPHYPGAVAGMSPFTVPAWVGVAPVIGTITHGISAGEYFLRVPLTHAGDHSGGGWIVVSRTGGFDVTHAIPRNAAWPYTGIVKGFVPNVLYTIVVYVFDALGRQSPSDTETYTIHSVPGSDKLNPGWDTFSMGYDPADRGLELVDTDGVFVFDDTVAYAGNSTLKLSITPSGALSVLLPEAYALQEGDRRAISLAVQASVLASTTAVAQWVYFDAADSEISREDIYNAIPPITLTPAEYKTSAAPATVSYAQILLEATDPGVGDVWFSRPIVAPMVPVTGLYVQPTPGDPEYIYAPDGLPVWAKHFSTGSENYVEKPVVHPTYSIQGKVVMDQMGTLTQQEGLLSYSEDALIEGDIEVNGVIKSASTLTLLQTNDSQQINMDVSGIQYSTSVDTMPHMFNTGSVVVGAAVNASSTDGFLYIPADRGVPSGTPTAYGQVCPLYFDLDTSSLWIYNTRFSTWVSVVLT